MSSSIQVTRPNLRLHHLEHRLGAEPTNASSAHAPESEFRLLLVDGNRLPRRGLRHQLHLAALLERDEPEDGRLHRRAHGQQAVVLQKTGLLAAQRGGDVLALLSGEHGALELTVHREVSVEGARVLRQHVDRAAERAEGPAVEAVRVGGAVDVGPGDVDGVVDHVRGLVEESVCAAVDDVSVLVHEDQVRLLHETEGRAQGVDPEVVSLDGISKRDVSGHTLVEPELPKEPEC